MCGKERGDNSEDKMYAAESFILRASIVLGMVAAVVTILYFTPMPDQLWRSCDRPCHDLDWPMICRVKLTIESYQTNRNDCSKTNATDCDNSYQKGLISGFLSADTLLPGPSIQVCQNDVLVVDVINKLPGQAITIHWRGQPQNEAPFMDGAPMITQCPINSYTTFQYKFRASSPGTHLWHAHSGGEVADGIFGALIVRKSSKLDPQRKLYDYDERKHVILVSEWAGNNLSALLINGKSDYNFEVKHGRRYRFRVAYGGGVSGCPVTLSIEDHPVKIVSLDGNPINAQQVASFTLSKGERADFVLKTNRHYSKYKMTVQSSCANANLTGEAVISYVGGNHHANRLSGGGDLLGENSLTTSPCEDSEENQNQICLGDIKGYKKIPTMLKREADYAFYFGFNYKTVRYEKGANKVYRMNNLTFTYPPSPLLTQIKDIPDGSLCSDRVTSEGCKDKEICECTHVEDVQLGATVEIILIDQAGDNSENIFHLHGYSFYVVATRIFSSSPSLSEVKELDASGDLFERNFELPVEKDTVRVPRFGVVALRFIASNPGYWMLRDVNAKQWTRGADVVFHVGTSGDLPAAPSSFPTCGSWVGPDFFLM